MEYEFFGRGRCLSGLVPDGSYLKADSTAEICAGDLVTIVMRPVSGSDPYFGYAHDRGISGIVKIYLGREALPDGEPVHLLGLLAPPGILVLPESRIDAMHRVSSVTRLEEEGPEATDFALSLILPFIQATAPLPAINPDWRPSAESAFFSMGSILETAAGPTIGSAADFIETFLKARDAAAGKLTGDDKRAPIDDLLQFLVSNNPYYPANLFYVRPALDYLFLNSMREVASPGYLKRRGKRRLKEYQQQNILESNSLRPFG
ncbi:hypothetical protein [Mesorhizobium australicum]|uniref:Uncharacterized protein n=1 Tax=Mesorhizobium australicum TaxID=536018 RepID=A0A1X7NEB3_9HYPH|nr:hypothetical protein [Mesorhizobium australicum]SMH36061.1 hypothetical protein SAMN02982922_1684 [Mesorhizobium australicum]